LSCILEVHRIIFFTAFLLLRYFTGNICRSAKNSTSSDAVIHAPFTLFPSPVLRSRFLQACTVQKDMNLLMHRVAN